MEECKGLSSNADLAGIGVRAAFYLQSLLNTVMVVVSPRDSVASAWAGTLLTMALIIAAMVQKIKLQLTLHHATLVLNYATLSCIGSLAVSPLLPIWRVNPNSKDLPFGDRDTLHFRTQTQHYDEAVETEADREPAQEQTPEDLVAKKEASKEKRRKEQIRERAVLSLALLTQVVLQWAWATLLFTSPLYSQTECNDGTVVILFMHVFSAKEINERLFFVWAFWLAFSLGITLSLTISLAMSGQSRAHHLIVLSRRTTISFLENSHHPSDCSNDLSTAHMQPPVPWWKRHYLVLSIGLKPYFRDREQVRVFLTYIFSFVFWILLIITSEWQPKMNQIEDGENDFAGFGQITAILLSLAPLWSLTVALYRYPALRKTLRRRQLAAATGNGRRTLVLAPVHSRQSLP
ncbi:unnamed protein product [Somion occarium]|uniref:Uncharacterized protein n=1 Tax=Somion occarium TaxID=3059160 RepID=A0ABP1E192_9APHY